MRMFLLVVIMATLVGCNEQGFNMRQAGVDAGSGMSVVIVLEAVPEANFEATKVKIIEVSTELIGFIDTGSLAQLPLDEVKLALETFMVKKGWGDYTYLVDTLVQYVKTQSVSLTPIGTNNLQLIRIGLEQGIVNAKRSTIDGRLKRSK